MEEDDKNAAAANMIGTSATDHQKEEDDDYDDDDDDVLPKTPLDSSPNITPKKRTEGPSEMNNSSASPLQLPLESSPDITPKKRKEGPSVTSSAETPTKRRRGRPPGSGSGSKKRKEEPSETSSGISDEKFSPHVIVLRDGQDVVEVLYNISVANYPKIVTVFSASGSVSEITALTPNGPRHRKGAFQILFLSIRSLVGDNGRHCREKAMCTVTCTDDQGNLFANTCVNSLIAAGRVDIIAAISMVETTKRTGAEFAAAPQNNEVTPIAAIPLQMIKENSDPAKEEGCTSRFLQTTPTVGDGNIINATSATASASNDQDLKSPSVGDTCQDMKSPSVGDT
ncbi:hypothetical protein RYX36_010285 [Vicia faba]